MDEDVYVLSCYLKTAVLGGNNNKGHLRSDERDCLDLYDELLLKSKQKSTAK